MADPADLDERLRTVIDPELGVSIVDLGLVHGVGVVDGVADQIRWALLGLQDVLDVEVELTHDPHWSPERMSDEAKVQLGWAR